MPDVSLTTSAGRYTQLELKRGAALRRARQNATLTIPSLMLPDGHSPETDLPTPWQGVGARGVNTLASKLLLALFPPNSPFFRLAISDRVVETMTQKTDMKAEFEKALGKIEREAMADLEGRRSRTAFFEALKQLINSGNVLVFIPEKTAARIYRLDRYVVVRDPMGNVLESIIREDVSPLALPKEIQAAIVTQSTPSSPMHTVALYTHIKRNEGGMFEVWQECAGAKLPGTEGSYPIASCPFFWLRMTSVDGEDYGRSYVEEYFGDLKSMEMLSKAVAEGSAASAKVIFLNNPNGSTRTRDVASAQNGDFVAGNAADISALQVGKFADFRVAQETVGDIERRLAFAFLMNSAAQRGGERVTAEEIRLMAAELEDTLGGTYSILAQELQLPLVTVLLEQGRKAKRIPALPPEAINPTIVTGLEALGRGHDLNKLTTFLGLAAQIARLPPEVNKTDALTRCGTSLGINVDGLIYSPEELAASAAAAEEKAMQQQMLATLGPNAVNAVRDQLKPDAAGGPSVGPQTQASPQ